MAVGVPLKRPAEELRWVLSTFRVSVEVEEVEVEEVEVEPRLEDDAAATEEIGGVVPGKVVTGWDNREK